MRRSMTVLAALALVAGLAAADGGALAATKYEFLFSANHVNDDQQLFLNLAVSSYGYDRGKIGPVLPRLRKVEDDLPVVLFLARKSGRSIDSIVDLRARGHSWSVIFGKVNVPFDILFVGIDRDPGPPYGKAWGHWKKRSKKGITLAERDIRGLVQIQMGSRWAGLSPYEMARAHGKGKSTYTLVADKKGRPHKGPKATQASKPGKKDAPQPASGKKKSESKAKGPKPKS